MKARHATDRHYQPVVTERGYRLNGQDVDWYEKK